MTQHRQHPSSVTVSSFALHQQGVTPLGSPSFQDWLACGHFIRNAEQSVQFWIGDWLLYGEKTFGKTDYEAALQETGLSPQTLYIYKYVAAALPLSVRRKNVSFHHHKEVANLAPETQAYLLNQAEALGWPLLKLKQEKYRLHLETARTSSATADSGLHLGDCVPVLTTLPDASVDMVLTAPNVEKTPLALIERAFALVEKKIKANSHLYLFCTWETYPDLFLMLQQYFTVKNLLVWETKLEALQEEARYAHAYECVLFAHKGRRHLNGRRDSSMLNVSPVAEDSQIRHPTEKPVKLLEYLIEKSTQPGETVLDPFMGIGSTYLAAKNRNRKYIGIEIEKQWYDVARSRLTPQVTDSNNAPLPRLATVARNEIEPR